jgi:hypothetical protein
MKTAEKSSEKNEKVDHVFLDIDKLAANMRKDLENLSPLSK